MNKSPNTSNSDTPKKSAPGTQPDRNQDEPKSGYTHEIVGYDGTTISTFTDEDQPGDIRTSDCELGFMFSGDSQHPIAVYCSTHEWTGSIS
jgi:hypothetical protein